MTVNEIEKVLRVIHTNLEYDGYGWWFPEWCITEEIEKLSFEEFLKALKERS